MMENRQEISALMDGELFEDEADALFDQIRQDAAAHEDWAVYHLIGDVLRQPEHIHNDLGAKIRERMQDEPVIMVPRMRSMPQKIRTYALSAAASVVAVGVVAWMSLQVAPETAPQLAMQQDNLRQASMKMPAKADEYLMAHQEFSPSTEMNGGTSYIRTVAYGAVEK
jgi:sigma-E factor negative regulatory protein RseA